MPHSSRNFRKVIGRFLTVFFTSTNCNIISILLKCPITSITVFPLFSVRELAVDQSMICSLLLLIFAHILQCTCYSCYSPPLYSRFNVNLQHGADVVLHVNPRYQTYLLGVGSVVHNTLQKGTWGSVERKFENPFPKGEMFSLQILVTKDSYKVIFFKPFFRYGKITFPSTSTKCPFYCSSVMTMFLAFRYLPMGNSSRSTSTACRS